MLSFVVVLGAGVAGATGGTIEFNPDSGGKGFIEVYDSNWNSLHDASSGTVNEEVVVDYTVTNQSIVNESFVVTPYQGRSFSIKITALHEKWGEKIWEYGVKFKGLLSDLELPEKIYPIIAIALIFFIGGFFGASTALQGSLVVSIVSWIFYGIGWLSLASDAVMISALSLATVMSMLGLLMDRGHKAGVQ